ncbi:MAG TPA: ABC transporter permease, partial [Candidatus Limnocylindrales bacterium]|nr:ABC transporter permease [Candidatus Limnocylindrales bacterium]
LGGTVSLAGGSHSFRVVGIVEDPSDLTVQTIILYPDAVPAEMLSTERQDRMYLVATPGPLSWAQIQQLNTHGIVGISRQVLADPPEPDEVDAALEAQANTEAAIGLSAVVAMAMLEIVLLAGAAFSVGARRRRRELALVAAVGGKPAHVRRIVLANGVVLGVIGAIAGVLVGVATAMAAIPWLETAHNQRAAELRVFPLAQLAMAGAAVLTGMLAAVVPARVAARQDVVTALAGRRGVTRPRKRWLMVGIVLVAGGAIVSVLGARNLTLPLVLTGMALAELGLVLCTPAVVGLVARIGGLLPPAPRIALRDTARNRAAAAPAISAVMAAVVGSVAIAVVMSAVGARNEQERRSASPIGTVAVFNNAAKGDQAASSQPFPGDVVQGVRAALPVAQVFQIGLATCLDGGCLVQPRAAAEQACPYAGDILDHEPTVAEQRAARGDPRCDGVGNDYTYFGGIGAESIAVVVDESAAAAVAGLAPGDVAAVAGALHAGQIVVSQPRYLDHGRVTLNLSSPDRDGRIQRRTKEALGFVLPHPMAAPLAMMTEETARSLGLGSSQSILLATTTRIPTQAEQDRAQALVGTPYAVTVERPPATGNATLLILAIIAGMIALAATAIATALATAEGRADLGTLAAVGASPQVRRRLSLSQSGVIAGLGSLIGTLAGLGAAMAFLLALNQRYAEVWPTPTLFPLTVPWTNVAIALVAVPVVAMLGAGLLTRSRLPIERRL